MTTQPDKPAEPTADELIKKAIEATEKKLLSVNQQIDALCIVKKEEEKKLRAYRRLLNQGE